MISIHAPTNGATLVSRETLMLIKISIHAPTNGATLLCDVVLNSTTDFNPRSDERSDGNWVEKAFRTNEISIHAPTNGATKMSKEEAVLILISIHAPTNGATKHGKGKR